MCEILFSILIVGAFEIEPGWMTIDYIKKAELGLSNKQPTVERMHIPTPVYLNCYE